MTKVKRIPDRVQAVLPMLVCRDVSAEIDFCKASFNALEGVRRPGPDGKVAHAALTINDAMIMIECEWPTLSSRPPEADGSSPVIIYVYVEDVDLAIEKAVAAGSKKPPRRKEKTAGVKYSIVECTGCSHQCTLENLGAKNIRTDSNKGC